jgi:hypothetical protein
MRGIDICTVKEYKKDCVINKLNEKCKKEWWKMNTCNMKWLYSNSAWALFLWNFGLLLSKLHLTLKRKLYVMDKSGYDFRTQRAEIEKEYIKYFKQWNHYRPV